MEGNHWESITTIYTNSSRHQVSTIATFISQYIKMYRIFSFLYRPEDDFVGPINGDGHNPFYYRTLTLRHYIIKLVQSNTKKSIIIFPKPDWHYSTAYTSDLAWIINVADEKFITYETTPAPAIISSGPTQTKIPPIV